MTLLTINNFINMTNLLLNIDAGMIDWARAQFALTAIYHWLFVPLTLGLAVIMGIMETIYYRTGKVFWKDAAISSRRTGSPFCSALWTVLMTAVFRPEKLMS